jgi:hypothetical protein
LAISFVVPTFAQQKDTVDPQIIEQLVAIGKKYAEAVNNNDAAAVARSLFNKRDKYFPHAIGTDGNVMKGLNHVFGNFVSKCLVLDFFRRRTRRKWS